MNTPLHLTRAQAESLLAAVRYEQVQRLADVAMGREPYAELKGRVGELAASEGMLLAALSRLDDLEARRAPHLRVATAGPGVRDGLYSADWLS